MRRHKNAQQQTPAPGYVVFENPYDYGWLAAYVDTWQSEPWSINPIRDVGPDGNLHITVYPTKGHAVAATYDDQIDAEEMRDREPFRSGPGPRTHPRLHP